MQILTNLFLCGNANLCHLQLFCCVWYWRIMLPYLYHCELKIWNIKIRYNNLCIIRQNNLCIIRQKMAKNIYYSPNNSIEVPGFNSNHANKSSTTLIKSTHRSNQYFPEQIFNQVNRHKLTLIQTSYASWLKTTPNP